MEIIYSDNDIIVLNKPAGIAVHGGESVTGSTVVDFLINKFPELRAVGDNPKIRPGIAHRLDKNTSGVLVVARTQEAFRGLKKLFQQRLVKKTYLAVCCGVFKQKSGTIALPIGRLVKNPLKRGVEQGSRRIRGARDAVTEYRVIKEGAEYSLVELRPKTGRMHQLRVHMTALHHPIACDAVYGGKAVCCPPEAMRQLLHAGSISFALGGKNFHFEADPPADFKDLLQKVLKLQ